MRKLSRLVAITSATALIATGVAAAPMAGAVTNEMLPNGMCRVTIEASDASIVGADVSTSVISKADAASKRDEMDAIVKTLEIQIGVFENDPRPEAQEQVRKATRHLPVYKDFSAAMNACVAGRDHTGANGGGSSEFTLTDANGKLTDAGIGVVVGPS